MWFSFVSSLLAANLILVRDNVSGAEALNNNSNTNKTPNSYGNQAILDEYEAKKKMEIFSLFWICANEPSCDMIDMVPPEKRTLQVRNCMCDRDCITYADCCLDSKYYNRTHQNTEKLPFHCSLNNRVYMKTTCPKNYTNNSVRQKCESSTGALKSANKKVLIPVTNTKRNITYGNEYCAVCNNDYFIESWNISASCSEISPPPPPPPMTTTTTTTTTTQQSAMEKMENTTTTTSTIPLTITTTTVTTANASTNTSTNRINVAASTTTSSASFMEETNEIVKRIEFDAKSKSLVSHYNGKSYKCNYRASVPPHLKPHLRSCIHALTSKCPEKSDELQSELCNSHFASVYNEFEHAYKNTFCAACNGVNGTLAGCTTFNLVRIKNKAPDLFSTANKPTGTNLPCRYHAIKEKFCL